MRLSLVVFALAFGIVSAGAQEPFTPRQQQIEQAVVAAFTDWAQDTGELMPVTTGTVLMIGEQIGGFSQPAEMAFAIDRMAYHLLINTPPVGPQVLAHEERHPSMEPGRSAASSP